MARVLYFDCFSGISGDMVIGALLDAGLPLEDLTRALGSLALDGVEVRAEKVLRAGVSATKFTVRELSAVSAQLSEPSHHHPHRHLPAIFKIIETSALSAVGRERARALFLQLAEAEAAIHQMPVEKVHLHEVGAIDSIVDIVGAVFAMEWAGVDEVVCSPLNVGGGMVDSAHGRFPVPAPATLKLLMSRQAPIYSGQTQNELVTPTGALIATAYAASFGTIPQMSVERIGYGAGDRNPADTPNVLRVIIGRRADAAAERVCVVECEIDDMNPQIFGVVMERLYAAGALEVFYTPVQMKKNRPGTLLTVIGPPALRTALTDIVFRESTTIGVRYSEVDRECLSREIVPVETPLGTVRFKVARRDGAVVNAVPEFDDCSRIAATKGLPVKEVQAVAVQAYRQAGEPQGTQGVMTPVSRFYITTPIYYINAEPHLGHAYTTMVADAVARAHRLMGDEVFFLTGTDEHGQKVERAAQKAGMPSLAFADATAQKFKDLLPLLNASNDDFIRTTEPRHIAASQALWRRVRDRGFIHKGKYEGWYCTTDEVFIPETQLQDGKCPLCGNTVERIAEESYFFKLSAFQQPLLEYYKANPEFVIPASRRNEVLSFLEAGLDDLSVSRTSFKWGIPVPDDPAHVMYVWFDALTNYMTAVGFGSDTTADRQRFQDWWPAPSGGVTHLIGKEIVRQHAIYWPAFLMAADLPLPRQIVSHGWWTMDGAKMSKSKGNVVRPQGYIERFGLDAFRYFVFREMNFGQDAEFTDEAFVGRYNADLANDLGNLVSRATTMIQRYRDGVVPAPDGTLLSRPEERALQAQVAETCDAVRKHSASFQLSLALREIWNLLSASNKYIVTRAPWVLAKDSGQSAELDTALYVGADLVHVVAQLIRPFMPAAGERTLGMLGVSPAPATWPSLGWGGLAHGSRLGAITPLFPRIEQTVEELQQMSDPSTPAPSTTAPVAPSATAPGTEAPGTPAPVVPGTPGAVAPGPSAQRPAPSAITYDDFMKVELRVAKVVAAERVPKSKKLLKLLVDVGTEQRTIVAGIAEAYEPEAMVGRSVVVVFNLAPAKLMGIESNGMVLCGSPEGGQPQLITFDDPPPAAGSRVR